MIKVFATTNMTYTPFKGFHEIDLAFFKEKGIQVVHDPKDADVIVSQHFKQLKPLFFKYFNNKKYLIWTLEPRFNVYNSSLKRFYLGWMKVHVMNVYTGDVFVNPLSFHNKNIDQKLQPLAESFTFSNKLLVGLMSYYKGLKTEEVIFNGKDVDLIKKRTEIGFYGHENNQMHVFGKGWPASISREDSRDGDWGKSKTGILSQYHFNLSFENTAAPRYTTEKIWDSIANYCLPVYYAEGTEIYNLFPENSFIDYSLLKTPAKLFDTIQQMSESEYVSRMNKCIEVYNNISNLNESEKYSYRHESLNAIVSKILHITS